MTRPRSSPEKTAEQNRGRDNDAEEVLRAGVDSIQIVDQEEESDAGIFAADGDEEEDEEGASASVGATASPQTTPKAEEKSRQRHASVQRVEHLHRFSLPAPTPVCGDAAPIVNVLPGPVVSR